MLARILFFISNDLEVAIRQPRRWYILSKRSIDAINRRSSIGNLWLVMTVSIFVIALSIVYGAVFKIKLSELMPHIAIGYVIWQLLSGLLLTMPNIFSIRKSFILQKDIPLSFFVFAANYEKIEIFLRQFIVAIFVCFVFQTSISFAWLMIPVALIIYFLTGIGLSFLIGTAALKYRDIANIISSMMVIIFLCTPVLWKPELLPSNRMFIVELNPFYHFIEIIRMPMIDQEVPLMSLVISVVIMIISLILGIFVISRYRTRIPFWL